MRPAQIMRMVPAPAAGGSSQTFGITADAPAGGGFPGADSRALVSRFQKLSAGGITIMRHFFRADTVAGAGAKFVVLADNAGAPGNVLLVSSGAAVPAGGGWVDFPVPGNVAPASAAGFYWLGCVTSDFQANPGKNNATGETRMANGTFGYASPPASWPGTNGTYAGDLHCHCTYTES